jgi:hypothetical protein
MSRGAKYLIVMVAGDYCHHVLLSLGEDQVFLHLVGCAQRTLQVKLAFRQVFEVVSLFHQNMILSRE